jgi:Tfp pilus assembly protein PilX
VNALATLMLAVTIIVIAVTGLVLRRSRVSALAGDDELAAAPVPVR